MQAVELFLDEKIGYLDIMRLVEKTCDEHKKELVQAPSLDEIVHYDSWAREFADQAAQTVVAWNRKSEVRNLGNNSEIFSDQWWSIV